MVESLAGALDWLVKSEGASAVLTVVFLFGAALVFAKSKFERVS